MDTKEAYFLLKENGFHYVRDARHGEIWTNGVSSIMMAHNGGDQQRRKKFICDIKRAVRAKEQEQIMQQPKVNINIPQPSTPEVKQQTINGPLQLPDIIIAILVDGSLTDAQKIKMIFAYTEL